MAALGVAPFFIFAVMFLILPTLYLMAVSYTHLTLPTIYSV